MKRYNIFGKEYTILQIVKRILVAITVPVIGPVYLISWALYKKARPIVESTNEGYNKLKEEFINEE